MCCMGKINRRLLMIWALAVIVCLTFVAQSSPTGAQARSCPGAPPLHLAIGMSGQVSPPPQGQKPAPVRVHLAPGTNARVLGQLHDGDTFKIIDGPICTENFAWWK